MRRRAFPSSAFERRLGTSFSRAKPLGAAPSCQGGLGWVRIPPSARKRSVRALTCLIRTKARWS